MKLSDVVKIINTYYKYIGWHALQSIFFRQVGHCSVFDFLTISRQVAQKIWPHRVVIKVRWAAFISLNVSLQIGQFGWSGAGGWTWPTERDWTWFSTVGVYLLRSRNGVNVSIFPELEPIFWTIGWRTIGRLQGFWTLIGTIIRLEAGRGTKQLLEFVRSMIGILAAIICKIRWLYTNGHK